jgi:hypothetical protein
MSLPTGVSEWSCRLLPHDLPPWHSVVGDHQQLTAAAEALITMSATATLIGRWR